LKSSPAQSTPFGRAIRNGGWLLTGKGLGAVLSIVYLALVTRSLGVEKFGLFTLILSTAQAVSALVGFQTWQIVVRYGMHHRERNDTAALGRLVRFCAGLDLAAALVGCLIAIVALQVLHARLGWSITQTQQGMLFCVVLLLSVRSTAMGILRLHDRFALGAGADAVTPIVRFVGALIAVSIHATVSGFLVAWAVSELATAAVYWFSATRAAPGLFGRWRDTVRAPGENAGLWHFALVTNLNATLNAASRQFVVVLVGLFTGAAAAGQYRLAYQLSQSLVRLSDLFARGVFPEFARASAAKANAGILTLVRQSTYLAVGVGLSTCLLVPVLGQPALLLIAGKSYVGAYPVLVLLGIAAGFDIMSAGFEPVLMGTGQAAQALRIRMAATATLFAGVTLLMPTFGAFGAGVATLIASAFAFALLARAALMLARQVARSTPAD
jgi:O-antigen/teichoic acid export membrane protein